jgi:hypothetical protein
LAQIEVFGYGCAERGLQEIWEGFTNEEEEEMESVAYSCLDIMYLLQP